MDRKVRTDRVLLLLYAAVLIAYPLIKAGRGLYVGDNTYSLGNFAFFRSMSGTWIIATWLANVLGYILTCLPFGSTMLGMNVYTSLLVSLTAIIPLLFLRGRINVHILFAGEILALGLCWCPTVILYDYLTYLLFCAGAILLYCGICEDRPWLLAAAGVCLGMNVTTRLPNVAETALILVVWFAGIIYSRDPGAVLKQTGICIAGYAAGFIIPWTVISLRYSPSAYGDMITNMFAMTDKAVDYKPSSMILAMFADYLYAWRWILLWIAAMTVCAVVYTLTVRLRGRQNAEVPGVPDRYGTIINAAAAIIVFGLVIRVCYGQGMFFFRYCDFGSIYFWAVILILFTSVVSIVYTLFGRSPEHRILSFAVLIIIYVTCIGSNNGLYPTVNNMFIIAPYSIWTVYDMFCSLRGDATSVIPHPKTSGILYAAALSIAILLAGTMIQSIGFHFRYEFNDGTDGEARDSYVEGYERTAHVRTTASNARSLQGIMDHMAPYRGGEDSVILYGEIAGMGYLLDMPSALSTFWPSLDSYNYYEWEADIAGVYGDVSGSSSGIVTDGRLPFIIVPLDTAAWINGDEEAISYFGVDREECMADAKLNDLKGIIHSFGYSEEYSNDSYVVYSVE